MQGRIEGGPGAGGAGPAMAHLVFQVRLLRHSAPRRVHGQGRRTVLRTRLPETVRRQVRLLQSVHQRKSATGKQGGPIVRNYAEQ